MKKSSYSAIFQFKVEEKKYYLKCNSINKAAIISYICVDLKLKIQFNALNTNKSNNSFIITTWCSFTHVTF